MIWDPKKLKLIINGKDLTPSGQDSHIKVERMTGDVISSQSGVNGDNNISEIYDYRYKLTIVNLGSDPNNALLDALTKTRTMFTVLIEDKSDGGHVGFASKGRVMTPAVMERGKEYKDQTWIILMLDYKGATLS
ncbi:MAG: hypothetical protein GW938_15605 [Leptospira sp.]|nr:hypothetical protein [Leptospira sp.]